MIKAEDGRKKQAYSCTQKQNLIAGFLYFFTWLATNSLSLTNTVESKTTLRRTECDTDILQRNETKLFHFQQREKPRRTFKSQDCWRS